MHEEKTKIGKSIFFKYLKGFIRKEADLFSGETNGSHKKKNCLIINHMDCHHKYPRR